MNIASADAKSGSGMRSVPVNRQMMLTALLERSRRAAVPIRNEFVQVHRSRSQGHGGALGILVSRRDVAAIDAYLLIHAVASAPPWECVYPLSTWALAMGFTQESTDSTARIRFSRVVRRLENLGLIELREAGWRPHIVLLREDCSGKPYFRPRSALDGAWFSVPYAYWVDGFIDRLSLAAKAMLLIALSCKEGFELPLDRAPEWYGLSAKTAERGLLELRREGLISFESEFRIEPRSSIGVAEVRHYRLEQQFSNAARRESTRRFARARHAHGDISQHEASTG